MEKNELALYDDAVAAMPFGLRDEYCRECGKELGVFGCYFCDIDEMLRPELEGD